MEESSGPAVRLDVQRHARAPCLCSLFLFFFFFLVIPLLILSSIIALSPAKPKNKCGRVPYDLYQRYSVSLVIYSTRLWPLVPWAAASVLKLSPEQGIAKQKNVADRRHLVPGATIVKRFAQVQGLSDPAEVAGNVTSTERPAGLSRLLTSWRRMRWAVIHPLELREAQTPLHSSHPRPASRKESSGTATSTRPDVLRLLFKLLPMLFSRRYGRSHRRSHVEGVGLHKTMS